MTRRGKVYLTRSTDLIVLGVPEDDTVFCSVGLGEGVHHGVGEVPPLKPSDDHYVSYC